MGALQGEAVECIMFGKVYKYKARWMRSQLPRRAAIFTLRRLIFERIRIRTLSATSWGSGGSSEKVPPLRPFSATPCRIDSGKF